MLSSSRIALRSSGVSGCALRDALLQHEVELRLRDTAPCRPAAAAAAAGGGGSGGLGGGGLRLRDAGDGERRQDGERQFWFESLRTSFRQEGNSSGA